MKTEISIKELAEEIYKMRQAQKNYFRHRHKLTLQRAIAHEKKIDELIDCLFQEKEIPKENKDLFTNL